MIVNINLPADNSYNIFIDELPDLYFDRKVVIVTNQTIYNLHSSYMNSKIKAKELNTCIIPDGEEYKNMNTIESILSFCFEHKLDRDSLIVAFGGGVIGDMTGFASSIYQRGINFIQIPTTLLCQVDASVGGKTGINNKFGKNLIGTFHQPLSVYVDTYFLKTLPKREFSAGIAEIIKMAVTFDKSFFEWIENNDLMQEENIKVAIKKSVQIKAKVVSMDEKEKGIRSVLNYGHTFAHVIENETNYKTYLHGEAVGIGICMANELSFKMGYINFDEKERIKNLLEKYNIPTSYKIKSAENFYEHFFLDKKSSNSTIRFILSTGIGSYKIVDNAKKAYVIETLEGF